jgi:hypothetical protein
LRNIVAVHTDFDVEVHWVFPQAEAPQLDVFLAVMSTTFFAPV